MPKDNWSAPMPLDFIPNGKLVVFTAMHQAAYTQYVQIIDSSGNPISFTNLSGQSTPFPISGQGESVNFFPNGAGKFYMQSGLQVQFSSSGSSVSLVEVSNPSEFYIGSTVYGGTALFVTEDGGGTDYNDTSFCIQWYAFEG